MRRNDFNTIINSIISDTKEILLRFPPENEVNIFLCGGASEAQSKFRYQLGDKLSSLKSKNRFSLFYPETLFAELSSGYDKNDLLTLENVLANSVSTIVIPLESPGTFAELGAFVNHPKLKDKLIIIVNPKYKNAKSFINDGPIAQLKKSDKSRILFYEMTIPNIDALAYKISETSRNMGDATKKIISFDNPLHNMLLYFFLIYVFDPINETKISKIINIDTENEGDNIKFKTALNHLSSTGIVRMNRYPYYSIINNGFNKYLTKRGYSTDHQYQLKKELQEIRIRAINLTLRNNKIWEGVD